MPFSKIRSVRSKIYRRRSFLQELDDDGLSLSLSPPSSAPSRGKPLPSPHHSPPQPLLQPPLRPPLVSFQPPPMSPPPLPLPHYHLYLPSFTTTTTTTTTTVTSPTSNSTLVRQVEHGSCRTVRARRNPTQSSLSGKSEIITPPYPWATSHRATVYSLDKLLSMGIYTISGEVKCKRCDRQYEMEFDLGSKFMEVAAFIAAKKSTMHDRAPTDWMNPILPTCKYCEQVNSAKPIIDVKKKRINWLFLLLGQMLGCCSLEQLKYFCKHTKNHRTGAKDRVLYLTYLGLCKQLDDAGPFDR